MSEVRRAGSSPDADLVVLGGGPGGYVAALHAARAGLDVVLVEESALGGVCLNEGCIPSKALIHAAEVVAGHGTQSTWFDNLAAAGGGPDVASIRSWQDDIVGRLRAGVAQLLDGAGVTVLSGQGSLDGPGQIVVTGTDAREVTAPQQIIATGSAGIGLEVLPLDGQRVVGSAAALHPPADTGAVVVVGGGYIGLEFASAYTDLGWQVTVVERLDRLLPTMDERLARAVHQDLTSRGVTVRCGTTVTGDDGTAVGISDSEGTDTLEADLVIVAVGRAPRSGGLGLDTVGVETDERGFITVDPSRRTTGTGIYAIGDVTAGPALAHAAMAAGRVAALVAAGLDRTYEPAAVPAVVYTRPELATVGLTPKEAEARGIPVEVHAVGLSANARSLTLGAAGGTAQIVVATGRGLLLGAQLAGPGVGEIIGTLALAIEMGATVEDLAVTVLPHPSISEVLTEVSLAALGDPRHGRR